MLTEIALEIDVLLDEPDATNDAVDDDFDADNEACRS
jgi:hypothetical protein